MLLPEAVAKQIIADHQRRPRHIGALDGVDGVTLDNPGCGDQVTVWADVREGRLTGLTFTGKGCAISQSSASLMTVALTGKTLAETRALAGQFQAMILGEAEGPADLGDLLALAGVSRLHARRKCALLAWRALEQALPRAD
ncbi:Fe-S cluster assembly sulfur transfer protein SufU [Deinococcus radiotolerans]|uniref:Iron-sulfur cluster assembly scaffold protein NifU n=1 Tax=Deinococcus radiotolerans TaxID=1309407 RepID=A0ABQ2FKF3_9DEIO|nr:SUF system NifU family Fe-S cluster assembly protein [Deinococcus radiotolerans]GGL06758.1 iron-sulfur cluster assembly scaffold protein NifU [Deinococcus radiotolerans]